PRLFGIAPDVGARAPESLTVDIDPRLTRRMLRLAKDVVAVVDGVEIDRLVVVADPFMRGRCQAGHGRQRRPGVDMRHHLVVFRPRGDVARPPHDAGYAPAALERRALLAAE